MMSRHWLVTLLKLLVSKVLSGMSRLFLLGLLCLLLVLPGGMWVGTQGAIALDQATLDATVERWQGSAHAANDINCSSCHQQPETKQFVSHPTYERCQSCHQESVDTFLLGKHGIRLQEGQSPLTPAMARLPMKADAHDRQMTCNTCHDVHSGDTVQAAVDSCLSCHNDTHSLNYENSRHAQLFAASRPLPRPANDGVSCATCHLPRHVVDSGGETVTHVNHNNTYTLLPRDRMVQEVCMNCHGVEYAYNSIFDDELVEANFDKPPTAAMETFDLVRALEARRLSSDDPNTSAAEDQ